MGKPRINVPPSNIPNIGAGKNKPLPTIAEMDDVIRNFLIPGMREMNEMIKMLAVRMDDIEKKKQSIDVFVHNVDKKEKKKDGK